MKKLLLTLAGIAGLGVLALGGAVQYLRSAEPQYAADRVLAGLNAPVELLRDSLGVPHVWASSDADAFRALGYLHAQDRLWQMELFRRVADGRLAEVLGPELLETDRFLRTLGVGRAAAAQVERMDAETRAMMEAYVAGVNAWIGDRSGALPPEFLALRLRPEPWTLRNSASIAGIMAWDLADWEVGLDLQRAIDRVGPELARELYPAYPDWGLTIVGDAGPVLAASPPVPELRASGTAMPRVPELAARLLESVSIARASNAWVVGGSRTASGRPIVANDPHLRLRAPSLWYLAALHGDRVHAAGVTIPGVPMVILGHTRAVGWGFTNAMADDVDFYLEQISPEDSSRYLTPEGWLPLQVRPETIQVRGAEPVVHTVRSTRHGPIVSDVEERAGDRLLSMRWTALEPTHEAAALLRMNRARDADEFVDALRGLDSPHQNVVFADTAGRFGYWMVGRIPVRAATDGVLPARGWTREGEWVRYLDFEEHPHSLDPPDGFVVTANNRQLASAAPHIGSHYAEPFRAMRIRELLEAGSALTAADVARQQMDVTDAFARRYLPHAVRAAEAAGAADAVRLLRAWDAAAVADSHAAALFYTWYEALRRRVGHDEFRGAPVYFPRATLNAILDAGDSPWVDDVTTPEREALDALAAAAMRDAVREVDGRAWGELHTTHMAHALGTARTLDRLLDVNVGPFASGGSPYTVNVAGYAAEPPFVTVHAASQRHVVDLGDLDGAGGFIIPTGQSGLPFSRHYRDQTERWREGRLWQIPLDRGRAEARAVHRARLRP